jgi:hypothetical protein
VPNFQTGLQQKDDDKALKPAIMGRVSSEVLYKTVTNSESNVMKRLLAIVLSLATPVAVIAQTTVFSDNFTGGSTIQSATPGAGTASSADYEVFTAGGAPAGYNLAPNDLTLPSAVTGSTLTEVAARFGGSPVTLASVGDYIIFSLVFVDTANVMTAGQNANASINIGLFNSGGVNLNQGLQLNAGTTTGGSQTYLGYVGRMMLNGNASGYNRNTQAANGTTSQNQDLLFNNASSSGAFNSPTGTGFTGASGGSTGFTSGLTQGASYTYSLTITLTAANAVLVNEKLFDSSNNQLINYSGTSTSGAFLGSTFDAFAVGFRYAAAAGAGGTMDISQITVQTIPEPSSMALLGFAVLGLGLGYRRLHR